MRRLPDELYSLLAHGSDGHKKWLRDTIESFWAAHRPRHSSPEEMSEVVAQAAEFSRDTEHIAKPPQALLFARAIIKLAAMVDNTTQERDLERAQVDRLRRVAAEERSQRLALQEEVETLERIIRDRNY
jgi:hypothetical protein